MFDIAIIGGGINGCGIARDAAGRDYSVLLAEMNDLASGTSSWSTKLVHGGLRYLEHYEFRLVREALAEREVLLRNAPHIIRPLRFVLPHHAGLRPAWMLRIGLFLYDHLGRRQTLPGTRALDLRAAPVGAVLKPSFVKGFEYSDCRVDDARLVVLNARDAANRGAEIRTRTKVVEARRSGGHWSLTMVRPDGSRSIETALLLVNAAGPWVDDVRTGTLGLGSERKTRLVKGSHIVVPRIGAHDEALIFQNADGRIIFAIPYERDFTLIGTTDEDYKGDPALVSIDDREIDYLCRSASDYFARPIAPTDVVWTYSGVRPLFDDGASKAQEATRDYVLDIDRSAGCINIFGGKITTYRRLAEEAMAHVADLIGPRATGRWTATAPLPGGDFAVGSFQGQVASLSQAYPFLQSPVAERLVRSYGTIARDILAGATKLSDLGESFGGDLWEREVLYLIDREWARSADDILWRRSKLGLHITGGDKEKLGRWVDDRIGMLSRENMTVSHRSGGEPL